MTTKILRGINSNNENATKASIDKKFEQNFGSWKEYRHVSTDPADQRKQKPKPAGRERLRSWP
jgi:hypothetical protein